MCLDKVGALMAQQVHDLVFMSAGSPGVAPSEGVMMMYPRHEASLWHILQVFSSWQFPARSRKPLDAKQSGREVSDNARALH